MVIRVFQGIITFAMMFMFITAIPTSHAENGQTYKAGSTNLNIRNSPSSHGQVIGQLGPGDKVVVFNESNGWGQTYYAGEEAWVALHYLYTDDESAQEPIKETTPSKITMTEGNVRVRSGPGTAYNMVASTSHGESFQLLASQNNWHKIALNNGESGWVAAWLTSSPSDVPAQTTHNETQTNTQQAKQSLSGHNIVLDPGHGDHDPGSIAADGSYEKNIALSTANIVADQLRAAGATVIMTRKDDKFLSLDERVSVSNAYSTDAFISLHYDAYPVSTVNGFSTHFYTSFGNDRLLAQSIQSGLAQHINLNNRGIMQSNYYVLRENKDLAVLVELGFITNPYDLSIIQTTAYQNKVAEGITNGLIDYFQ